jgi:hypothetical protein
MLTGLASSWDGKRVARSRLGDAPVQVWDLDSQEMITEFPTVLDAGGSRLAISRDGSRVAAAAYARKGLAMYDAATGACRWRRADIKKIQEVGIGPTGTEVWCIGDAGPARILDAETGTDLRKIPKVQWMCQSPLDHRAVVFDGQKYTLVDGAAISLGSAVDSSPLGGAFGDAHVCLSEVAGPLRCFTLEGGNELHVVMPTEGWHWTQIGFVAEAGEFAVIRYPYEHGGQVALQLFIATSGRFLDVGELPSPKYTFCCRGSLLLGSHGDLRHTRDGSLVHHFGWFTPEAAAALGGPRHGVGASGGAREEP